MNLVIFYGANELLLQVEPKMIMMMSMMMKPKVFFIVFAYCGQY